MPPNRRGQALVGAPAWITKCWKEVSKRSMPVTGSQIRIGKLVVAGLTWQYEMCAEKTRAGMFAVCTGPACKYGAFWHCSWQMCDGAANQMRAQSLPSKIMVDVFVAGGRGVWHWMPVGRGDIVQYRLICGHGKRQRLARGCCWS